MDAERAFRYILLALSAGLTFLLLRPYATVILGAVLLAYLLSGPYARLAAAVGDRPAAMGLILATGIVLLVPLVLVLNLVLSGVGDLISLIGQDAAIRSAADLVGLLESVFDADFEDPAAVIDLLRRGEVVDLLGTVLKAVGSLSEAVVYLTVLLFVWY